LQRHDAGPSSSSPNTRSAFENPAIGNSPSSVQPPAHIPANPADATIVRLRRPAIFSSRAARLTAGPMQVKSSRLPPPMLP
jgi:hypothetical protein